MADTPRRALVKWIATRVMPHETEIRAWLARARVPRDEIDDVIQEAYCRLYALEGYDGIDRPGAYFFSIARNLLLQQLRRRRIVQIQTVAEIEAMAPFDESPSAEQQLNAKLELARLRAVIETLPERCRRIFEMRKIERLSQKEIAARMGVNEGIVENETRKAMALILAALNRGDQEAFTRFESVAASRNGR
jgi:RNA polymerase sigma factor (sigma-70 family)